MYRLTLAAVLALSAPAAPATILFQQDFHDFTASGLAPGGGHGTLDSTAWSVTGASEGDSRPGDRAGPGDFGRGLSMGSVRAGGLYAFELPGGGRGLGLQATGSDFTPGALTLRVRNPGPDRLGSLVLAFDLWLLNDGARATAITVESAPGHDPLAWHALAAASRITPLAADDAGWHREVLLSPLPHPPLASGDWLSVRWRFQDAAGGGARDELAITSLQLAGLPVAAPAPIDVPAPPTALLATALAAPLLATARRRPLPIGNRAATAR